MEELTQLITVERHAISLKIQEAREEGDLKENGGYHAAKEEQGKIESRINRLEEILASAEIGEANPADGIVKQGLMVSCKLNGSPKDFYLGSHVATASASPHQTEKKLALKLPELPASTSSPESSLGSVQLS